MAVMQDSVADAMVRGGYAFAEEIFYQSAVAQGFPNAKDRAMALYRLWQRDGFRMLPEWCRDWVLECCEGKHSHGCASF